MRIPPGKKRTLPEYFLKYCPKYLKVVKEFDANEAIKDRKRKLSKNRVARKNTKYKEAKGRKPKPKPPRPKNNINIPPSISNIGIGILSCNRLHCVKRLLESIEKYGQNGVNVIVSDESTDQGVKNYLRSVDWITLLDHPERKGVVHNTNKLLHALIPYKYKMILNDDVEIKQAGWEMFYFNAMVKTNYHHFCYREYNIYGANKGNEKTRQFGRMKIKTITGKPQGAVMTFDDVAFKQVGYYDHKFPRYGMAHVDWSNRVSKSGIQPSGFHDVEGANDYFKIYPEKTVEENKSAVIKQARQVYDSVNKLGRLYIPPAETYPSRIHMMVNSYNRPDLLDLLLTDVKKNKSNHEISVYVYDDASTISYDEVLNKHKDLNIAYKKLDKNHGKREYWQVVNHGFMDAMVSKAHFFIKLDDDVRLVNGFFDKCISYWNNIPDPRKICINPLLDDLRKGKAVWTGKNPKEVTHGPYTYWNSGWVDMMFFCERRFFEELNFKITPICKSRWARDSSRSSGVGAQISERLTGVGLSMYQPGSTLVTHKDHQSQMHGNLRKQEPIVSTATQNNIIISMACVKERMGTLKKVVNSLTSQCDHLNVYLNDFEEVPKFLSKKNITIFDGKKLGDIGDIGKFYAPQANGYIFTVDDDLIYPPDYVSTMINKIEQYNRKCCVGVHGVILNTPMVNYYKSRKCFHYKMAQAQDIGVHVLGTGTLAYHSDTIQVCKEHFSSPNMADIWFAILAQKKKVGLKCVARPAGWIKDVPGIDHKKSIHGRNLTTTKQTNVVKSFGKWTVY